MHPEPCSESHRAMQFVAMLADLGDRGVAADHRHDALVVVMKRPVGDILSLGQDVLGRPCPGLEGHRAELGVGSAVRTRDVGEVAEHVDAGKTLHREVGQDVDAAAVSLRQAGLSSANGAAIRPPPQATKRVLIVVPSESFTWPGPTSWTAVPSRNCTPSRCRALAAYSWAFSEKAFSNECPWSTR